MKTESSIGKKEKYLLDSYAWVEFFLGTAEGERVKEILEQRECFTSIISISQIVKWALRNDIDFKDRIARIEALSEILYLDKKISELSGKINFNQKRKIKTFGMIDSIIYATAKVYNLPILTGDEHFRNLDNVE